MNFMEATEKNAETVDKIIKILHEGDYTVQEAYSILDFTKGRIKYISKVGEEDLNQKDEKAICNDNELINLPKSSKIEKNDTMKWYCVARWINRMYDNFREERKTERMACDDCLYFLNGCGSNVTPPENFEIIERFTGKGTVIGLNSNYRAFL